MLKEKLRNLNLQTSGNKATLLIRLEEAAQNMEEDEIARNFPNIEINDSSSSSEQPQNTIGDVAENPNLEAEIQHLRDQVQKQKEINDLRRQLNALNSNGTPSSTSNTQCFNFRDVEDSLNTFNGDDKYKIASWVQHFEETAKILNWNDTARLVYGRRLLTGTAKLFLRTIKVNSWIELKEALVEEFECKISSAEVHNQLRARRKKADETWQQYLFSMQEIATQCIIEESDLIQYVISGVNDSYLNKLILYNANTLSELKLAFQKYEKVKLYSVKSTDTKEAIKCLQNYFDCYSRPNRIVSDRGTCFTSEDFKIFLKESNVEHVKIATATPQANGQIERVNRVLKAMLAKECECETTMRWDKHITKIEFAINNTINRSTGFSPSNLLFGVSQKGEVYDRVAEYINNYVNNNGRADLMTIRSQAEQSIVKNQSYNKLRYDKTHKKPHSYQKGEFVMLKNNSSIPGVNKKLFAKYRGPYEIKAVLENDRYLVTDLEGMQISRVPYRGICSPGNMKPFYMGTNNEP